jgi:hypothetical protein
MPLVLALGLSQRRRGQQLKANSQQLKKIPAPNNAGLLVGEVGDAVSAELFSCLFYVAASRLNSPRLVHALIRRGVRVCQVKAEGQQFWQRAQK